MTIFISYAHADESWVHSRLIPVLDAAGGKVLVDKERFKPGRKLIDEMNGTQGMASRHLLVLTKAFHKSDYCKHELKRAIEDDPDFKDGKVLPVKRDDAPMPAKLKGRAILGDSTLYVDLQDDSDADQWSKLIENAGRRLVLSGTDAPTWLTALDRAQTHLERGESVNLVVKNQDVNWRRWLDQLIETRFEDIAAVDLEDPRTVPRDGLIGEILKATGRSNADVPLPPNDLPLLADAFEHGDRCHLALKHFDSVMHRDHYGVDFFGSMRWLVMEKRKLVLLVHSDVPIADLLPPKHKLSYIDFKTVELG